MGNGCVRVASRPNEACMPRVDVTVPNKQPGRGWSRIAVLRRLRAYRTRTDGAPDGRPDTSGWLVRMLRKAVLFAALCTLLWLAAWVMDRASLRLAWFTYVWTYGSFANALPVVLVFLFLLVLCNRAILAFMATLAIVVALYAANFLKLKYLDVPISFNDIYVLENMHVATIALLTDYVKVSHLVAFLLVALLVVAGLAWLEPSYFKRRGIVRLAAALVVVFGLASVVVGAGWVASVYGAPALRVAPYSPLLTQVHAGLISSVLNTDAQRRQAANAPIDAAAASAFLKMDVPAAASGATTRSTVRPDIVVIQSESFFDSGILAGLPNTLATLPNLHRALASGTGGTMDPPTYGGNTLRTEFEVLTGIPLAAYPQVEFPYLQIVQPTIPGFVHVLRHDGYATVAIHANSATFWNRNVAFRELGFQKFISRSEFPANAPRDGWYISDQAMTDQIIATLDKATSPTLVFAVSIEAHGPYLKDPVRDPARRDAIPAPVALHGKALLEYRNYMYHVENADRQLGRLWDFLARRERPFILVFYGDHLPALTHVYAQAGFDNGLAGTDQFVPWFMVGTGVKPATAHIDAWMMGSDILAAAGVPLPPYFRLVAKAQAALVANPDDQRRAVIEQGINALAQMHLRGKFEAWLANTDAGRKKGAETVPGH